MIDAPLSDVRDAAPIVCARHAATITENRDGSYHLVGSDRHGHIDAIITITAERQRTRFHMEGRITRMPVQIPDLLARIIAKMYRNEIEREARRLSGQRLGGRGISA